MFLLHLQMTDIQDYCIHFLNRKMNLENLKRITLKQKFFQLNAAVYP